MVNMTPQRFSFGSGRVAFWGLDRLRQSVSLKEQIDELKEDLAQVVFPNNVLLDVGWYPEFDESGSFVVVVVRGEDWSSPLFDRVCSDMDSLVSVISEAATFAGRVL